ncbi:hypothetical protein [Yersinia enterocolitica]|uniref:hypothetical protein n=1 Tax=Yersinia enterocolitica TaxID=630 RepID=UPI003F432A44
MVLRSNDNAFSAFRALAASMMINPAPALIQMDVVEYLLKRIEFLRRHSKMLGAFKTAVKNGCFIAGASTHYLAALTETTAMELYLDEVQEEIFLRVAKAERAMELDATQSTFID